MHLLIDMYLLAHPCAFPRAHAGLGAGARGRRMAGRAGGAGAGLPEACCQEGRVSKHAAVVLSTVTDFKENRDVFFD